MSAENATKIANGSHANTLTENCVMEHVALRYLREHGVISTKELLARKTDAPGCTAWWITKAAISVNDVLNDTERQRLEPLIDRLLYEARIPADPEKRKRVLVRVLCWSTRSVLHLVRDEDREVCEHAIETAEAWLRGEATEADCRAAASAAASAEMDLVLWLDDLIDAHVKALGEEGLLGDEDAFEVWAVENVPA